ncbi:MULTISPECIES: LytR/AlgR family response regulator transcription factor [Bacteroidota]|uniref:LytR/AlgR family response regulator transcription factor n=1 Tax=Bacteroidota TaxID=976 RepID=UPI00241C69E1|nr:MULTISPECIES: LytTR family DNA-binding domain-containing protein [Bacteroidota]
MKCIIIDDEPLGRAEIKDLIQGVSDIEIAAVFINAHLALEYIKNNPVDLIFLDIEMPMLSGLDFAEQIHKNTLIIFTTAYPEYALKSYEFDAIDYLLKPIDKERLRKSIDKAKVYMKLLSDKTDKSTVEGNTNDFLLIKSDRRFHKVEYREIKYIEGLKDYVVIHLEGQRLITAMNLRTIHQKIPQERFIRVSKSYVINLNFVRSFDHNGICLGETEIPLGDVYKKGFFKAYLGDSDLLG